MNIWARASTLFLSFHGRAGRGGFWVVIAALLAIGALATLAPLRPEVTVGGALACLWPCLAISIKRLRDMGKPAKLIAIPVATGLLVLFGLAALLPFALLASAILMIPHLFADALPAIVGIAFWLAALPQIVFLIWIGLKRGKPAPGEAVVR